MSVNPTTNLLSAPIFENEESSYSDVILSTNTKLYFVPYDANSVMAMDVKKKTMYNIWSFFGRYKEVE